MRIETGPDGAPTERYVQLAAMKILLGAVLSAHREVMTAGDAAVVLVSLAGDCAGSAAGNSAIELGKLTASLKDDLDKQALTAFNAFNDAGLV